MTILDKSNGRLEINALFIQPTRWCARACSGCYVHSHNPSNDHVSISTWYQLFTKIFSEEGIRVNQLTMSVDTLPNKEDSKHSLMKSIFNELIVARSYHGKIHTELHLTCHSLKDIHAYTAENYRIEDLEKINLVSLSTLSKDDLGMITSGSTKINWNHTPPARVTSENIQQHIDSFLEIASHPHISHIYILTHKTPVGTPRSELLDLKDRSRMLNDVLYMKAIMESVPVDVRSKITLDGCLQDSIQYNTTGYGCSSNVSRFQIWPDGSVSGCPYALRSDTGPATTINGILENIRTARKSYDFNQCHLPTIHSSIIRR